MNFVGLFFDKNSYFQKIFCSTKKTTCLPWWSLILKSGLKVDSYNIAMHILTYGKWRSVHGLSGVACKKKFFSIPYSHLFQMIPRPNRYNDFNEFITKFDK